jgi:hypothetical protein
LGCGGLSKKKTVAPRKRGAFTVGLRVGDDERGDVVGVGEEVGVGSLEQPLHVHEPVDVLLDLPSLEDGKTETGGAGASAKVNCKYKLLRF